MKKYTVYTYNGGEIVPKEVDGREVNVSPFLETFIHRQIEQPLLDPREKYWVVSEITTGHAIARGRTQKQAIKNAAELCANQNHHTIESAILRAKKLLAKQVKD